MEKKDRKITQFNNPNQIIQRYKKNIFKRKTI